MISPYNGITIDSNVLNFLIIAMDKRLGIGVSILQPSQSSPSAPGANIL